MTDTTSTTPPPEAVTPRSASNLTLGARAHLASRS